MSLEPLARRAFALDDQLAFARLSGDFNPVHVDPIAARRTLVGAPIVHGVHLVLWALDRALPAGGASRLVRIDASFPRPTYLERELSVYSESPTHFSVRSGGDVAADIHVELGDAARQELRLEHGTWPMQPPREVARDTLETQRGELPLRIDESVARTLFPSFARDGASVVLSELLALTRLVGMECPGLHSLFTGIKLTRRTTPAPSRSVLAFEVERINPKYGLLSLRVSGPEFEGSLEAFVRPAPRPSLDMRDVAQSVTPGEFASITALVVGGTRGLGETIAKAVAAGGGRVTLTYHRGEEDAARVCREIGEAGGTASAFAYDVTSRDSVLAWPADGSPSHLFYLATPFIRIDRSRAFDADQFDLLSRYYVSGFARTIEACRGLGGGRLIAWAPSTAYLDAREPGTAAYTAAKAALEELGKKLTTRTLQIVTPRLGRVRTDQTASLTHDASLDALPIVVAELRALLLTERPGGATNLSERNGI